MKAYCAGSIDGDPKFLPSLSISSHFPFDELKYDDVIVDSICALDVTLDSEKSAVSGNIVQLPICLHRHASFNIPDSNNANWSCICW